MKEIKKKEIENEHEKPTRKPIACLFSKYFQFYHTDLQALHYVSPPVQLSVHFQVAGCFTIVWLYKQGESEESWFAQLSGLAWFYFCLVIAANIE